MQAALRDQMPFLVLSLLTGLSNSFIFPLMSYFLVDGLALEPFYIGVYTSAVTLIGLVMSQYLGSLADRGIAARKLYILAMFSIVLAMLVFIFSRSFWPVFIAGVLFMSLGAAAAPQMLTIAGQWAQGREVNIVSFNARVRAAVSLAWIAGPPLAFLLVAEIGFAASFVASIICVLLALVFVLLFVPEQRPQAQQLAETQSHPSLNRGFYLVALMLLLGFAANIMYSSSMPLYLMNELGLPEYLPGLLMGLVAALEIPIMLWSSRLSERFGTENLMIAAFALAVLFYLAMYSASELWMFVVLQLVNASFFGLYAGLGLSLLQAQLPQRLGFTSAVYTNAIKLGMMLGSSGAGLVGQFWSFQAANLGALVFALLALLTMLALKLNSSAKVSA